MSNDIKGILAIFGIWFIGFLIYWVVASTRKNARWKDELPLALSWPVTLIVLADMASGKRSK